MERRKKKKMKIKKKNDKKESSEKIEQQTRCRHSSIVGEGMKTEGAPPLPHSRYDTKLPATKTTYKYNTIQYNSAINKIQTDTLSALKVGWLCDKQVENTYKFRYQKHQSPAVGQ